MFQSCDVFAVKKPIFCWQKQQLAGQLETLAKLIPSSLCLVLQSLYAFQAHMNGLQLYKSECTVIN